MIYPTLDQLSKDGKYDRYTVTVAAAKGARMVTEEYVAERERAEMMVARKETDKSLISMIKREYRDEKAVKSAINRLHDGEFDIIPLTADAAEEIGAELPTAEDEAATAEE